LKVTHDTMMKGVMKREGEKGGGKYTHDLSALRQVAERACSS
jgi:hypothetical protein